MFGQFNFNRKNMNKVSSYIGGLLLTSVIFLACSNKSETKQTEVLEPKMEMEEPLVINSLTEVEKTDGWLLLFDGETSNGWRGFKQESFPNNWEVVDGTLHMIKAGELTKEQKQERADLVYEKPFENFVFKLEWKISEGGNSGIFYLGQELPNFNKIYHTAPEMQVLDNDKHPDAKKGKDGNRKSGSLYDLIPAKPQNAKAVGEWNEVEITINERKVTHKQNGVKVLSYDIDSPEWKDLVANSKFPGLNENWVNLQLTVILVCKTMEMMFGLGI
jgi:hypothetical protein